MWLATVNRNLRRRVEVTRGGAHDGSDKRVLLRWQNAVGSMDMHRRRLKPGSHTIAVWGAGFTFGRPT